MAGQGLLFRSFKFIPNGTSLLNNRITNVNLQLAAMGIKQDTRDKLVQLRVPEKPKKPLTPYNKFVSEYRSEILKNFPGIKPTDLIKKCAEEWKNVSEEMKSKYSDTYNVEREKYDIQFLKYHESLSPEQKEAIQEFNEEKKKDKEKRKLRKMYKETNKPKKPMGPYMHYLVEQSEIRKKSIKELMSHLHEEWAKLSEQQKQKYQNIYLKEKQDYEAAMEKWEAKMLAEGREDLIRVKSSGAKEPSRITELKKPKPQ